MDCKVGYVYVHINKINGKAYVGQTKWNPEKRWGENGYKYKKSTLFFRAIQKYGWDNFNHIILYKGCPAMLDLLEEMYIKKYDSYNNGYNLTSGGLTNRDISNQTKQKLSEIGKSKKYEDHFHGKVYRNNGNKYKAKKVRCIETGEIFDSATEAAISKGWCKYSVAQVCRGENKSVYNTHWEYI